LPNRKNCVDSHEHSTITNTNDTTTAICTVKMTRRLCLVFHCVLCIFHSGRPNQSSCNWTYMVLTCQHLTDCVWNNCCSAKIFRTALGPLPSLYPPFDDLSSNCTKVTHASIFFCESQSASTSCVIVMSISRKAEILLNVDMVNKDGVQML
jgi:hypothetical protein